MLISSRLAYRNLWCMIPSKLHKVSRIAYKCPLNQLLMILAFSTTSPYPYHLYIYQIRHHTTTSPTYCNPTYRERQHQCPTTSPTISTSTTQRPRQSPPPLPILTYSPQQHYYHQIPSAIPLPTSQYQLPTCYIHTYRLAYPESQNQIRKRKPTPPLSLNYPFPHNQPTPPMQRTTHKPLRILFFISNNIHIFDALSYQVFSLIQFSVQPSIFIEGSFFIMCYITALIVPFCVLYCKFTERLLP